MAAQGELHLILIYYFSFIQKGKQLLNVLLKTAKILTKTQKQNKMFL